MICEGMVLGVWNIVGCRSVIGGRMVGVRAHSRAIAVGGISVDKVGRVLGRLGGVG